VQTENQVGHLSAFVHLFIGLDDHGDEGVSVCLSGSYHLLQPRIEAEIADVLFFTAALAVAVSYAGLD
jgi:hypothetical protein